MELEDDRYTVGIVSGGGDEVHRSRSKSMPSKWVERTPTSSKLCQHEPEPTPPQLRPFLRHVSHLAAPDRGRPLLRAEGDATARPPPAAAADGAAPGRTTAPAPLPAVPARRTRSGEGRYHQGEGLAWRVHFCTLRFSGWLAHLNSRARAPQRVLVGGQRRPYRGCKNAPTAPMQAGGGTDADLRVWRRGELVEPRTRRRCSDALAV